MHKTTQTQINNLVDELRQKLFAPNADFSKAAKISMGTFIDKTIEQILQNLDRRLSDAQKDEKEIIIKTEGEHLNRAISLIFEEISDKKKKGGLTEEVLSEIVDKHLPAPVVPKDKIGSIILSVKSTLINKSSSFNLKKMGSKSNLHEEQLSSSPPKFGSKLTKDSSS